MWRPSLCECCAALVLLQLDPKSGFRNVPDAEVERRSSLEVPHLTIPTLKLISFRATSGGTLEVRLSTFKARTYAYYAYKPYSHHR